MSYSNIEVMLMTKDEIRDYLLSLDPRTAHALCDIVDMLSKSRVPEAQPPNNSQTV